MEVIQNHIDALELFNEKADKLLNLPFVEALLSEERSVTISGRKQENGSFAMSSQLRGPSQDKIDAFVLTFRFFIQDRDGISFRSIATIYDEIGDDDGFLSRFKSAHNAINQFLDSPNLQNITFNEWTPTNRDVMNIFIYGDLAHTNPDKCQLFKAWMEFPPGKALFEDCFTSVLGQVLGAIDFISNLNQELISSFKPS